MNNKFNKIIIKNSKTIIGFELSKNGWERYITLDGKRAYYIGNICGTCAFLLERLDGATNKLVSPKEITNQLKNGITNIDKVIDKAKMLLPNEEYYVNLLNINPKLVNIGTSNDYFSNEQVETWGIDGFWGFSHHPRIRYYRGKTVEFSKNKMLFEFIVPMFPQHWLEEETINEYKELINNDIKPTALSISILDIKQHYDSDIEHWCLTHYIIDGHHKLYSASQLNKDLSLLTFISINKGVSTQENIEYLLQYLH